MNQTDQLSVKDHATITVGEGQPVPARKYEVLTEIFKDGKIYSKGQIVELNEKAGQNFVAAGDVKEVS